jgi:hypothetical protein
VWSLGRPRKRELERGDGRRMGERSACTGLAQPGQCREVRAAVRAPSAGERRHPRLYAANSDQAVRATKDQSGPRAKEVGHSGEKKRKVGRWADWAKTD